MGTPKKEGENDISLSQNDLGINITKDVRELDPKQRQEAPVVFNLGDNQGESGVMSFGKRESSKSPDINFFGKDEEKGLEMANWGDRSKTIKNQKGQEIDQLHSGNTIENNFFGSNQMADSQNLPVLSRGLTMIQKILNDFE
jgi:hypothetical protein